MTKILMYMAMFVGAVVVALWASRELSYFLRDVLYWIRTNWLMVFGISVAVAIGIKVVK